MYSAVLHDAPASVSNPIHSFVVLGRNWLYRVHGSVVVQLVYPEGGVRAEVCLG